MKKLLILLLATAACAQEPSGSPAASPSDLKVEQLKDEGASAATAQPVVKKAAAINIKGLQLNMDKAAIEAALAKVCATSDKEKKYGELTSQREGQDLDFLQCTLDGEERLLVVFYNGKLALILRNRQEKLPDERNATREKAQRYWFEQLEKANGPANFMAADLSMENLASGKGANKRDYLRCWGECVGTSEQKLQLKGQVYYGTATKDGEHMNLEEALLDMNVLDGK